MLSFSDYFLPCSRRMALTLVGFAATHSHARASTSATQPAMMHAKEWSDKASPLGWWVSEKYDGVRAWWDGRSLLTRLGNPIAVPDWLTANWPETPLDGELWCGRGRFEQTAGTIRQRRAVDTAWHGVRYMVFDLPAHGGPFHERLAACARLTSGLGQRWVQAAPHELLADTKTLQSRLNELVAQGGEGLMLHHGDGHYRPGRSDDLRKLKTSTDAEAEVIGHLPGRGRHAGRIGALQVRTAEGVSFRIGTGLTDAQRTNPPPVGSWITFRYRGTTESGVPRFANYLRPAALL